MITNEPTDGLFPARVEEPETNVNEILQEWEDFDGVEPAEITAMRASQRSKAKSDGGDEGLYPPGVE